jgi:hypothetical protein
LTPDRVAEALAALQALEAQATRGPWHVGPYEDDVSAGNKLVMGSEGSIDAEFIARWRNAAPALLKLAKRSAYSHAAYCSCTLCAALAELAEAVLGP